MMKTEGDIFWRGMSPPGRAWVNQPGETNLSHLVPLKCLSFNKSRPKTETCTSFQWHKAPPCASERSSDLEFGHFQATARHWWGMLQLASEARTSHRRSSHITRLATALTIRHVVN